MNILAPGGHSYGSLQEALNNIFLLNNIEHDKSEKYYMMPPHFLYSMADVSDEKIEKHFHKRLGDIGEHLVYRALEQYSNTFSKTHHANIIVINGLKVDDSNKPCFKRCNIWPTYSSDDEPATQEFPNFETDFFICRYFPECKYGDITAIEVKASTVISASVDAQEQHRPPASYKDALHQLNVDEKFLVRLCKLTNGYNALEGQIGKVAACLSLHGFKEFVEKDKAKNVKFILNEDIDKKWEKSKPYYDPSNLHLTTVSLCDWFLKNLSTTSAAIPENIYFDLLRLLIFMKTCVGVPKSKLAIEPVLEISDHVPSSWVMAEGQKIDTANILSYPSAAMKSALNKNSILREKHKIGAIFRQDLNIVLLTLDQLDIWENQNKKMAIIGFAGTGKTVLALAKAIQLCRLGEKVAIVTPSDYVPTFYSKLHSLNDPQINENLSVHSNEELFACFERSIIKGSWYESRIEHIFDIFLSLPVDEVTLWDEINNEIPEFIQGYRAVERMLGTGSNIIFDDVMTVHYEDLTSFTHATILSILSLLKLTSNKQFKQIIWLLFDPIQHAVLTSGQMQNNVVIYDEKWHHRKIEPNDYYGWLDYAKSHYMRGRYPLEETDETQPPVVDRDGSLILLLFLLWHASGKLSFHKCQLVQSMRQCEEAFRYTLTTYTRVERSRSGNLISGLLWRPLTGSRDEYGSSFPIYFSAHKIQGKTVTKIQDGPAPDDFEGIAVCIIENLKSMFSDGIPLRDVAILVRSNAEKLRKAFNEQLLGCECLGAKDGYQQTLVVDTAWNVPSFEWPIVVYVNEYDDSKNPIMGSTYFTDYDYMCLSRSQSWVIVVYLKAPPLKEQLKSWRERERIRPRKPITRMLDMDRYRTSQSESRTRFEDPKPTETTNSASSNISQ